MATPTPPEGAGEAPAAARGTAGAAARTAEPASPFLRKLGPLPVWAWMLIGLGVAVAYSSWRKNKTAAAATSTSASGTATDQTASQTPPFIIQNYTSTTSEPSDVNVSVSGTQGPPGATGPAGPPGLSAPTPVGSTPISVTKPITPAPPKSTAPKKATPLVYRVKPGDTLTSIAAKYHTTASALWTFNTAPGNRPASTIATLKKRGPNLLYSNEEILIPT